MKVIAVSKTGSKGYAKGPVFKVERKECTIERTVISEDKIQDEIERYEAALAKTKAQIVELAKESEIFEAYIQLVDDPALIQMTTSAIEKGQNAESAVEDKLNEFILMFESMDDEYMRERAADLKDVKKRIQYALLGIEDNPFEKMTAPSVIVAEELTPSDTANMNFANVLGFLTEVGGVTSHVSIIAKGHGIPCLTGVKGIMNEVTDGMEVIVDASDAKAYIEPDEETIKEFVKKQEQFDSKEKLMEQESGLPSETKDGHSFMLCANVGNIDDIKAAMNSPMEGIGLLRSEFIYMMKKDGFPSEEEQFEIYKEAATLMGERELTIRTLDIGGDKGLDYFEFQKEDNPFLGCRAIRLCLNMPEMFKNQLRALLRASVYGNLRIMYPMIISMDELRAANKLLEECKEELRNKNQQFREDIKVGMMIETPASVLLADEFAKHVNFFSIGTNDLTQYLLAVDRGNESVAELYDSFHPAVIKAINHVIECAHKEGVTVGMCGEFAGSEQAAPLLLGMGLDEFSMSAGSIKSIKYILRNTSYADAKELVKEALAKDNASEVKQLIETNN